jgi:hypothetical protein
MDIWPFGRHREGCAAMARINTRAGLKRLLRRQRIN